MVKKDKKELKKVHDLLLKYNVKNKVKEEDLQFKKEVKEISELTDDETSNKENIKNVEYNIIKDDIARLESYQELIKSYKLNDEQINAVSEIYNRAKENQNLIEPNGSYKALSETARELTDLSKRIINEISGNYIKSIDEYRRTP